MTLDAIQPQIDELRADISRQFPLGPVPATDEITDHQCEECWQVRDNFAGLRWTDVPQGTIDAHFSDLPLFTPIAHRYYFPAYLLRTLNPTGENWSLSVDFVIYALCPDLAEWRTERFGLFSSDQLRVAAVWLKLVLDQQNLFDADDVVGRRGYEQYWAGYMT